MGALGMDTEKIIRDIFTFPNYSVTMSFISQGIPGLTRRLSGMAWTDRRCWVDELRAKDMRLVIQAGRSEHSG